MGDIYREKTKKTNKRKIAPARTPEEQEQLMINLSMKQAEQMLIEGRAPAQIVVHFLRLATENAKLQNDKLKADTEMALSKSESIKAQVHYEELIEDAMKAFRSYGIEDNKEDIYE